MESCPRRRSALRSAGLATNASGFQNSAAVAHPRLLVLGDILAVPKGWPLSNVYSIGDICIAIGVIVVIHALCRPLRDRDARDVPAGDGASTAA